MPAEKTRSIPSLRVVDISRHKNLLQGGSPMATNWIIRPVIFICFLSATVLLGGCSPPLPKTWLPSPGGTMHDIHVSSDR